MNIQGASSSGTASSASGHPLPSLVAVMGAPERRKMPLLHPKRRSRGLCIYGLKQSIDMVLKMNGVDPIPRQNIPCESGASAPSPHSDSSQELNQQSPTP
ncbi:hypothetical protein Bca4012_082586 [Brassica carinata]|uniref:Uncharacterized protein n=1 Tax=Brassica carinata TaxID=52824 RepID=A0A8X7VEK3_BRACI|nr:hypothetical protein Bca52824_029617 [Brassica carinata]